MRRRNNLKVTLMSNWLMAPGTHKIDHLISEPFDVGMKPKKIIQFTRIEHWSKYREKKQRRSSNYQDINNKQKI